MKAVSALAGALLAAALVPSDAMATVITLHMGEVANQPIDGLTVSKGGVNFTFSDPTQTLFYNSGGPGSVTYVQDPSVQGPPTPFSVTFSVPVTGISFGLAELAADPLFGASVTLSDLSVHTFDLTLVDPFPEGQFNYAGAAVTGFLLTPAPGAFALAFDNLSVTTASAVPEPSGIALLGVGIVAFAGSRWRRRSKPAQMNA